MKKIITTNENIDELVEEWHKGSSTLEIHEYLGITIEQYFKWVETNKLL